jgi:hypothetical protein
MVIDKRRQLGRRVSHHNFIGLAFMNCWVAKYSGLYRTQLRLKPLLRRLVADPIEVRARARVPLGPPISGAEKYGQSSSHPSSYVTSLCNLPTSWSSISH